MKAGQFNIHEYLEKLYEESTSMMDGGEGLSNVDGIIIPDINKKSYDWLKKEYNAKQTEVKVEISGQGSSFKPGYDLQTDVDSVKEFKPGIFGEVKTKDTKESQEGKDDDKKIPNSLDAKKTQPNFQRGEGEKPVKSDDEKNKTKPENDDIKDKKDSDDVKVKKMDLKTKKTEEDKEDKEDENKEKDLKKEKNGDKE
jgi:hypothetical protein